MSLSDISDKGAVIKALEEFDALERDAFLKKYGFGAAHSVFINWNGKRYDSKAILGAAHAFQFPDKGPLEFNEFSGGEGGTAQKLRSLGFELVGDTDQPAASAETLREAFDHLLKQWTEMRSSDPYSKEHPLSRAFEAFTELLREAEPVRSRPQIKTKWSVGRGNWAKVPWIGLLDERTTKSIQSGVYCVFLFREDRSGVYLTLNQGVMEPTGRLGSTEGLRELQLRGEEIRPQLATIGESGFALDNRIDLRSDGIGKKYEKSTISYKLYSTDAPPSGDELLSDLETLLDAYDHYVTEGAQPPPPKKELASVVAAFASALEECHVSFGKRHVPLVRAFVASLATKPFVILTGLSGSGKTQLALQFGEWLGESRKELIPVRPDWTGAESIFGYEDALQPAKEGRKAWQLPAALSFILQAARDSDNPYVLVLDEMNLAHVERYFADVLSGMESQEPVLPDLYREDDGQWRTPEISAPNLPFPRNLFVIGTVNVDETTYMFSPKVLDRANTIEFRVETDELSADAQKPGRCAEGDPALVRGFLEIAVDEDFHLRNPPPERDELVARLRSLHMLMAEGGFEFGHRVFYEALRFASMLYAAGETNPEAALDLQVLQKVLPRLHGSRRRLEPLLCGVGQFCHDLDYKEGSINQGDVGEFDPLSADITTARLPLSFKKVQQMTRILRANQFVSFTE